MCITLRKENSVRSDLKKLIKSEYKMDILWAFYKHMFKLIPKVPKIKVAHLY